MRYFTVPNPETHYGMREYLVEDENHGPWEEFAYAFGAAAAFGLMGMAEAIRERMPWEHPGAIAVQCMLRESRERSAPPIGGEE